MELQRYPIMTRGGTNNTHFSEVLNLIVEIPTQIMYNDDDGQSNLPMCILLYFVILFIYFIFKLLFIILFN